MNIHVPDIQSSNCEMQQVMLDINPYAYWQCPAEIKQAQRQACKDYETDIITIATDPGHLGSLTQSAHGLYSTFIYNDFLEGKIRTDRLICL